MEKPFSLDKDNDVESFKELFGIKQEAVIEALKKKKTPVIWLSGLDCTGCIESFLRSRNPGTGALLLEWISLEYSELLAQSSGEDIEANKKSILEKYHGEYILVIEGAIPLKDEFLMVAGQSVRQAIVEAAKGAKAVLVFGSCSSWGGIPAAYPNPTESVAAVEHIKEGPFVIIPGCPPIPEVMAGTLLYIVITGKIPDLDKKRRPKFFYECTIHKGCHRKRYFDDGLFAESYDDEGARKGYCLFKLGCKGPSTFNACESLGWSVDKKGSPINAGASCIGCSEKDFWDKGPLSYRSVKNKGKGH
ncbi:MAG TPA: [NiFe] hydrogenase small subunit HydA [Bacillus bacterium]|nr:[NiFe] hydrogenase small subunit HydA [Bacillus sp. (in: firmicutes)]